MAKINFKQGTFISVVDELAEMHPNKKVEYNSLISCIYENTTTANTPVEKVINDFKLMCQNYGFLPINLITEQLSSIINFPLLDGMSNLNQLKKYHNKYSDKDYIVIGETSLSLDPDNLPEPITFKQLVEHAKKVGIDTV